ncbi:unnamed protein product [Prorocentrum cordatum]|uniref:Uncharacterized protein n=1 Tax=Prorocentrum cordatum TaxID=2364126 RepID=A0ABN9W0M7_9DINO|nr:unnamed protein product [Polarella glacialis]
MQLVLGSQVLREELTLVQASLGDGAAVVAVGRPDLHTLRPPNVASSGRSGRVTIWSLGSAHLGSLGWRESAVLAVAFSRGADQLAMGAAERYPGEGSAPAVVWALPSCRQERVIEVPGSSSVRDVAFSRSSMLSLRRVPGHGLGQRCRGGGGDVAAGGRSASADVRRPRRPRQLRRLLGLRGQARLGLSGARRPRSGVRRMPRARPPSLATAAQ